MTCYHPSDGGFGASPRNDSHLLSTLSALQILALLDELHRVDHERVVTCECVVGFGNVSADVY
jgi:geranylgeranyl transferase type-2 subunit beta